MKKVLKASFFVLVFILVSSTAFGTEWIQMRGDDGRIWFIAYHYYVHTPVSLLTGEIAISLQKAMGAIETRPTHVQSEAIKKIAGLYKAGRGDVIMGSIGRNQADTAIFGNILYYFVCEFTSETRYTLWFGVAN